MPLHKLNQVKLNCPPTYTEDLENFIEYSKRKRNSPKAHLLFFKFGFYV